MYIKQSFNSSNSSNWNPFLYFCLGVLIIITLSTIFQLPWLFAVFYKLISVDSMLLEEVLLNTSTMSTNDLMKVLESNLNLFLLLFSFLGFLLGAIISNKIKGKTFLELTTSRKKIDWGRIFFSFTLWGSISAILIFLDYNFISAEKYEWNFELNSFLWLLLIVVIFIPIQTSAEEYVFRGWGMQSLGDLTRTRWFPLIFTSITFGLMHAANPEVAKFGNVVFIFYIGSGFFAGIMTLMDEGMELALGWHAANNMIAALLVTADWTALQTNSVLKDISNPESMPLGDVLIPVLIFFPIILIIFAKKYKWNNWRKKLFGVYGNKFNL